MLDVICRVVILDLPPCPLHSLYAEELALLDGPHLQPMKYVLYQSSRQG